MSSTGRFLVPALWAVGLATGLAIAFAPHLLPLPTPILTVPLIAALVADVALMPAARAGRIAPITMNDRGIGVIGAGVIAIAVSALLAR